MKTKQEQTKQMLKTLCDKFQCSAIDRSYMAKSCRQCEDIIEALHEAGYGDVTEYKAEVKRLKKVIEVFKNDTECNLNHITVENGQLKAKNKVLKDGIVKAFTNGFNEGRKQVEKDIRRTKINAMNELKEKIVEHMGNREYMGVKYKQGVFSESEIDEFIKEIEQ